MTQNAPVSKNESGARTQAVALLLFDGTVAQRLPSKARRLLALAAAYHSAAAQIGGDDRSDRVGRDLALAARLPDLSVEHQSIVASAVAFQRAKVRPQREPAFFWLGEKDQRTALCLAAVLRLAGAIDTAPIELLAQAGGDGAEIVIGGVRVEETLAAVEERAALWRAEIGELTVRAAAPGALIGSDALAASENGQSDEALADSPVPPGILRGDTGAEPIAEAARRTLRRFFDKLLAREDAVLKDEDLEDVHQMRVATRRLRAALQILVGVYEPELIRRYRKGLRRIAESLGAVRDGDVFLEHIEAHRDALDAPERTSLEPLIAAASAERAQARETLLKDLDSRQYNKFKREFAEFLSTPGAGTLPAPEPGIIERVRDFAGSAIWRRYELWRAYAGLLQGAENETLHQARIAGKRFRYTLEFFAETLGSRVDQALEPLTALQENLGQLQDEVTARAHVAALGLADDLGAQSYLAARGADRERLLAELPKRWEKIDSGTFRRRLFEMIVKL